MNVNRSIISPTKATPLNTIVTTYHEMITKCTELCIIRVLTDGSKSSSGVGASEVADNEITRFSLSQFLTVLSPKSYGYKLAAIKLSITCIVERDLNSKFLICFDSPSFLNSLQVSYETGKPPIAKEILT